MDAIHKSQYNGLVKLKDVRIEDKKIIINRDKVLNSHLAHIRQDESLVSDIDAKAIKRMNYLKEKHGYEIIYSDDFEIPEVTEITEEN